MNPWGRRRRRAHSAGEWRAKAFAAASTVPVAPVAFDFIAPRVPTQDSVALVSRLNPRALEEFCALRPVVPLYPHQQSGVAFILGRYRAHEGGGYFDDVRTGKTRAALVAAVTAQQEAAAASGQRWGQPSIFVCPKDVLPVARRELEALYGPEGQRRLAVTVLETDALDARETQAGLLGRLREGTDLVLVSVSYLTESTHFGAALLRDALSYRLMFCDEAHEYVTPGSVQTSDLLNKMRADSKWYMTGTPLQNSLDSLTHALTFMGVQRSRLTGLSPKALVSLARAMTLRRTWNILQVIPRTHVAGMRPIEERLYRAALEQLLQHPKGISSLKLIQRLRHLALSPYLCRDLYEGADAILTLPEGVRLAPADEELGFNPDSDDVGQLVLALAARETTLADIGANPALAWAQLVPPRWPMEHPLVCDRVRRQTDTLKTQLVPRVAPKERCFLQTLVQGQLERTGEKAVLFSAFREPLQRMARLLQLRRQLLVPGACDFVYIDGDLSAPERERERERFASDPACQVLLATIGVNSRGVDLTCANHVVINDPSWNPTDEHQATGRVRGPKQTRQVHVYRLVLPGTIDVCVCDWADAKVRLDLAALPQTLLLRQEGGPIEVPAVAAVEAADSAVEERARNRNVMEALRAQAAVHSSLLV
jgi:SNF2 family DNA or RNA helicase